jgi:glycosyltransferase involved in cell wall biosynthesis
MASRGSYLRKSLIVRLVKVLGGKSIIHLHGGGFREFYGDNSARKQAHIRKTFEIADAVIVLSSQWVSWAKSTFEKSDHIRLIYNAVPPLELNRDHINVGEIAFLGRVNDHKGVSDLIKAFAVVKASCPIATLKIAGDGNVEQYQAEVELLGLSESVSFLGWVAGSDKDALLSQADIYCLPSYKEGFPMGVLEAMSAGVPVVASRAGGIPDAIENGKEGVLFDAGDIDALSHALISVINDRELNQSCLMAARAKFERKFSTKAVMPQLDSLYAELLNEKVR